FGALFPCGSVTGAPKIAAMKMIRSLECFPRGVYTGAIGLVRPGGDSMFSVAIRTLILDHETGRAVFGVGGGITYDSSPDDEYAECLTKARFLTEPRPDFQLIETLRLEAGAYFLLDRHVSRMLDSARFFGFLLDEASIRTALEGTRLEHQQGTWRVRLLGTRHGAIHSDVTPLLEPSSRVRRVAFGPEPMDSQSPFLCHKTTHRY